MPKGFSKNNPLDKLSGTVETQTKPPTIVDSKHTEPEQKQDEPKTTQKRKVGRPTTRDVRNTCRNINIAVPIVLLDKWDKVKLVHGNNLTAYITKLIERDMENNYERYKDILNNLNNI